MSTLTCDDLAQRLTDLLDLLGYESSPIADAGEAGAVDWFADRSPIDAEVYVQRRLSYALRRLTAPFAAGRPAQDARIALGAHVHLQQIQGGTE